MQKTTVTLADIAKEVGTSVNTVSRALRDCSDIGQQMKERVRRVAEEMGYVPNKIAEFLRSKRSNMISVIIASLTNPYFSICVEYMLDYMMEHGYRALISVKKGNMRVELDDVVQCVQNGACGIISFLDISREGMEFCEKNKIPFLLCGKKPKRDRVNAIYADDIECGATVAQEALARQAKRPCYVEVVRAEEAGLGERGIGFTEALKGPCDVYRYDYSAKIDSRESITNAILANGNDFIFCFNDEIALILSEALKERDAHPTIYGVDRLGEYLPYCGGIGSVGTNVGFIGRRSAELIVKMIENYDGEKIKELLPIALTD